MVEKYNSESFEPLHHDRCETEELSYNEERYADLQVTSCVRKLPLRVQYIILCEQVAASADSLAPTVRERP